MSSFRAGAAVLAFAALVSGCAALGQFPPSNALIGEWTVEDVDNAGVVERANLTVVFDETSRISGSAGCNRYTGAYSYDASTGAITVTPLGVTRMMCAPALMNQERLFITSLQGVTSVETAIDGATVLKSATGRVLLRRRTPAPTTAATKAKPPVGTTTTASLPPPPTTTTPNYPPSSTQYPLSGGPSASPAATTTYTPPYASAPPIAPTQVTATGELYFLERVALPPGATVRIQLRDTARADAPALMLVQQEFAAGTGGPYPFSISAPLNVVPANARLSVTGQIRSGNRLLFTTDAIYPVSVDGPTAPMRLRLVNANPAAPPVPAPVPSPVPAQPTTTVTPVPPAQPPVLVQPAPPAPPTTTLPAIITGPTGPAPLSYRCGSETVKVAFDATMAWMTTADGVLAVPRVNPSDDPFAQRMYSNNRVTFIQDQEGAGGGRVQFARGRAALLTCAKVG